MYILLILAMLGITSRADMIWDLTANESVNVDGMIISQYSYPAATGNSDPFLVIQNNGEEEGYNTSGGLPFDTKAPFTQNLLFNSIPTIMFNDILYREILLDINEPNNSSLISMEDFQIYQSDTPSQFVVDPIDLGMLIYDLDFTEDGYVLMDGSIQGGGGSEGDIRFLIPDSEFDSSLDYVYLYSEFGEHSAAGGGFEEFSVQTIPEPTTLGLIALGILGIYGRKKLTIHKNSVS